MRIRVLAVLVMGVITCGSGIEVNADTPPPTQRARHVIVGPPYVSSHRARGHKLGPTPQVRGATTAPLNLRSASVFVLDQPQGKVLLSHNATSVTPIASITKLMTAMVTLDGKFELEQPITIAPEDADKLKGTHSRLTSGTTLTRQELLRLALMSSENRAAAALARTYPGGRQAFVKAMNLKAQSLGMQRSHFVDPAGLSRLNVSTAEELAKMVVAASAYPLIREFTTTASHTVSLRAHGSDLEFKNSNRLIQSPDGEWNIQLSKTGYTAEAGRCLVLQARIAKRPVIIVLLDAWGKLTPVGDANRIRRWMEAQAPGRRVG